MSIEIFNRVEEKYIITREQYKQLVEGFRDEMTVDTYSKDNRFYQIANIYYDTEDNNLIRISQQKPVYKEKLRLRAYGVPNEDSKVFFEVKKKYRGVVNKRRSVMTLKEAYAFSESMELPEIKDYMNPQVLRELKHSISYYNAVPKVYLAYERRAFFGKNDSSFRVTFDRNIIARRDDLRLENGIYGDRVVDEDVMIMEVKFSERPPLWFLRLINKFGLKKGSFSKYGTEYNKYLSNIGNEILEVKKYA
jgi:SPX domain protein involved in polyphosphate accumulation